MELLEQNTGAGKAISLGDDGQLAQTWGRLAEKLAHLGFHQVGLQATDRLYKLQLDAQETLENRLHKGVALQVTGEIYLWLQRYTLAKRFFNLRSSKTLLDIKIKFLQFCCLQITYARPKCAISGFR